MGKGKFKCNQNQKSYENINSNSTLQEKLNESEKAKMVSVLNGIFELPNLQKQSDNFHHGVCVTTNAFDCALELPTINNLEILKEEDLFEGNSKMNPLQKNSLPKITNMEKVADQSCQYMRKQNINCDENLFSDFCDTQLKNQSHSSNNSENYEGFVPEFLHAGSESSTYENNYEDFPSCSKSIIRNCKGNVVDNMNAYTTSKNYFSSIYTKWLPERRKALEKLRSLLGDLHNDQKMFNKTQALFRGVSYSSRLAKCNQQSHIVDFIASVSALVGETSSGVTSILQAYNIDIYQSQFKEIMDHDAEITKELYDARSQCIIKYQGIEEVIRTFHADTFDSTVEKISDALEINKFGIALENIYGSGDMSKLRNIVSKIANKACESEVLAKIGDSLKSYITENPAALEACKSVTKAAYEMIDAWNGHKNRSHLIEGVHADDYYMLMMEDKMQLEHLRFSIDEDLPQTKLESRIEDAIDSLESEMEEIQDMYYELF